MATDPGNRPQRLAMGIFVLLVVDIIWVASSEFTEYIFKDLHYEKPFFTTYFKTTLFSIYLVGFAVYKPWRGQCVGGTRFPVNANRNGQYQRLHVQEVDDDDTRAALDDSGGSGLEEDEVTPAVERTPLRRNGRTLSSPMLVPANIPPDSGKSSGNEESDVDTNGAVQSNRRVRFKQLAEVVEMNPAEAIAANLARLSYNASLRARAALRRAAARLTVGQVALLSLVFCLPWFGGNYCYQAALSDTEAAVVNVLSASSSLFTLILAAIFPSEPGDRITLSKFAAVCFSLSGVVLVSYSDISIEGGGIPSGAIWAVAGAFFYSVYIVLLRRKVNHEDNMDAPMFFGFVGLFNAILLWPGLILLHVIHKEPFELPTSRQWEFLIINGLIGTVISELLWLWGCLLTSSLMATLSIGLTIPLSILADVIWKHKTYEPLFVIGAVPMFCSFFVIAILTHLEDWDPLMDLCRFCCRSAPLRRSSPDDDRDLNSEHESLMNETEEQLSLNDEEHL